MLPYLIKTFRGGISDESDKGVSGAFKFGYGLEIHGKDDILACKSTMATVNESTITDLIHFFVNAADGSTYGFSETGKIYSIAGSIDDPVVSLAYTDTNGKIKGAAQWEISDGNNYLFWATDTSISRRNMTTGEKAAAWTNQEQNWKTTLDPADWHTMANASGALQIANNEYLAAIDFDGNFDPAALNVRPGNLIKCLEERDDYVIMGSERLDESEEGHIWSWVTTAVKWLQKKRIPVKGVNALITAELMLMQGGAEGEIFFSDFTDAEPIHQIPGRGQVMPGGVAIEDDLPCFGFFGGDYPGIWNYGRRQKNRPFALNYAYRLAKGISGSLISTVGALTVSNGRMLASWGTTDGSTSDYGIDGVSSTLKASATYEGLEFDNGMPYVKKPFDTVKLNLAPLDAGCSVSVKFKTNKQSAWEYAVMGDGGSTFSQQGEVEAIFSIGKPAMIYEVGVDLNSSLAATPKVLAITTYLGDTGYEY